MRLLYNFVVPVILLCTTTLQAQTTSIRGTVINSKGTGLKDVAVSLLAPADSALQKAGITDLDGNFSIDIPATTGQLIMHCTFIGFKPTYRQLNIRPDHPVHEAGTVVMEVFENNLQVVEVKSTRPLIQALPGKTVFNVQGSINATGSSAMELLQKCPGVMVDNNDNISVKGKTGVKVYVDGKMLQYGPEDLAAYLRSINSTNIALIEIFTQPGPAYDAAGSAGVINIRLKKNTGNGTNGSIEATYIQAITPKGNTAFNLNHRNTKFNVYANGSFNTGHYQTRFIAPRVQKDTLYDQHLLHVDKSNSYQIKLGMDYFINSRNTIGIMNSANWYNSDWVSYGHTKIYEPNGAYLKQLDAVNIAPKERTAINTNLNYRYADTSGTELNFDADHGYYRGSTKSYQPNYYRDKDGNLMAAVITRNNTPTDIDIYTAKFDAAFTGKKGRLSAGAKWARVKTANELAFFTDVNGTPVQQPSRSYDFTYKETVTAAYINYSRAINPRWHIDAGLRIEHTESTGVLTRGDGAAQPDNNVKRSYTDFFPFALAKYNLSDKQSLQLSYGRRIDRPNYQQLNPFELKLDELSYVKGNSFLKPQYTDNIELGYTIKTISITASYSHVKDLATQTVDTFQNYTYAYSRNLANQQVWNLGISTPATITPWWNAFMNAWVNQQHLKGRVNDSYVDMKLASWGGFMQHSFLLGKDYTAELSGWYNGPTAIGATLRAKALGGVDIGLQKQLFKKRATLRIAATDIFRTAVPFIAKTDFGGVLLRFWVTRESQAARVSFTYRFGRNNIKASRQRQAGLESETKRIS